MKAIDVIILAGGFGKRLKKVMKNKPKCLALINGQPFIDLIIDNCISVGYEKNQIIEHLQRRNDCEIIFSPESKPLGTGGAIKLARRYLKSDCFVVMNGDSFIDLNFEEFYQFHIMKNTILTIAGVIAHSASDYGSILIDDKNCIIDFIEKGSNKNNLIVNAGIYCFNKEIFKLLPNGEIFSIEEDFFSSISKINNYYLYLSDNDLFDIGTPKRLEVFQNFLKGNH